MAAVTLSEQALDAKYRVFMSYSHADKRFVEPRARKREAGFPIWLHRRLENYRVPQALRKDAATRGIYLPPKIGRVFRDDDELASGEDLGVAIDRALAASKFILVVCSPRAAQSKYVDKEIRRFKAKSGGRYVLAVIIDGKPDAPSPDRRCFPPSLRHDVDQRGELIAHAPPTYEPLAADLQEFDRETVFLKIAAGVLGVEFGDLKNRDAQAQRFRRRRTAGILAAGALLMVLAAAGLSSLVRVTQQEGVRRSATLTQAAVAASDQGLYERAARFSLAAMKGRDTPLLGYDARAAEASLARAAISSRVQSVLLGHRGTITSFAFSPDGSQIATASEDGTARIWVTRTGRAVRELAGARGRMKTIAFSPNGTFVCAGGSDGIVRIWNAGNGEQVRALTAHLVQYSAQAMLSQAGGIPLNGPPSDVSSVVFSPDGALLATAGTGGAVRVWSTNDWSEVASLPSYASYSDFKLRFSPDGRYLAAATSEGVLLIWDRATWRPIFRATPHAGAITSLVFSPSSDRLVTTSSDRTARVWNPGSGQLLAVLQGHSRDIWAAAFEPHGRFLVTASQDGAALVWDMQTFQPVSALRGHTAGVISVSYSPDGSQIATASDDGSARLWNARDPTLPIVLRGHARGVWLVDYAPDGSLLATASPDNTVRLWRPNDETTVQVLESTQGTARVASFTPAGALIASLQGGTMHLWDVAGRRQLGDAAQMSSPIWSVAFSADGRRVALGTEDGRARVLDVASGRSIAEFRAQQGSIPSVALSRDGSLLVVGGQRVARVWSTANGAPVSTLTGHERVEMPLVGLRQPYLRSVAFAPTGRLIATSATDHTIRLWDSANGRQLAAFNIEHGEAEGLTFSRSGQILIGYSDANAWVWDVGGNIITPVQRPGRGRISVIAISNDDRRFAAAGEDGFVFIWSTKAPRTLNYVRANSPIHAVAFSPDGERLATGTESGAVTVWDAASGGEIQSLRGHHARVTSVSFSPDGTRLLTAASDLSARIWNVSQAVFLRDDALIQHVCTTTIAPRFQLDQISPQELAIAPVLDGALERSACSLPSPLERLRATVLPRARH